MCRTTHCVRYILAYERHLKLFPAPPSSLAFFAFLCGSRRAHHALCIFQEITQITHSVRTSGLQLLSTTLATVFDAEGLHTPSVVVHPLNLLVINEFCPRMRSSLTFHSLWNAVSLWHSSLRRTFYYPLPNVLFTNPFFVFSPLSFPFPFILFPFLRVVKWLMFNNAHPRKIMVAVAFGCWDCVSKLPAVLQKHLN